MVPPPLPLFFPSPANCVHPQAQIDANRDFSRPLLLYSIHHLSHRVCSPYFFFRLFIRLPAFSLNFQSNRTACQPLQHSQRHSNDEFAESTFKWAHCCCCCFCIIATWFSHCDLGCRLRTVLIFHTRCECLCFFPLNYITLFNIFAIHEKPLRVVIVVYSSLLSNELFFYSFNWFIKWNSH